MMRNWNKSKNSWQIWNRRWKICQ